jgi:hypothetical protein
MPRSLPLLSTVIIAMMTTAGHGFCMLSGITVTLIAMVCYAFVDDTSDVIQSASHVNQNGEAVETQMQKLQLIDGKEASEQQEAR